METKLDPITAMVRYGKEHGMTYGEVQTLFVKGRLSYEQLGCEPRKNRYAPPEPTLKLKICPVCGVEYAPNRDYQKFCSVTCQRESRRTYADYHKRRTTDKKE